MRESRFLLKEYRHSIRHGYIGAIAALFVVAVHTELALSAYLQINPAPSYVEAAAGFGKAGVTSYSNPWPDHPVAFTSFGATPAGYSQSYATVGNDNPDVWRISTGAIAEAKLLAVPYLSYANSHSYISLRIAPSAGEQIGAPVTVYGTWHVSSSDIGTGSITIQGGGGFINAYSEHGQPEQVDTSGSANPIVFDGKGEYQTSIGQNILIYATSITNSTDLLGGTGFAALSVSLGGYVATVPEPSTFILGAIGLIAIALVAQRRK